MAAPIYRQAEQGRDLAGSSANPDLTEKEQEIVSPGEPVNPLTGIPDSHDLLDFSYPSADTGTPAEAADHQPDEEGELVNHEFEQIPEPPAESPRTEDPAGMIPQGEPRPGEEHRKGFTDWIEKIGNGVPPEEQKQEEPENEDLIEKFINGGHGPIRADKETSLAGDVSGRSIEEDESFVTDTLAKIYVKQGLYSKAILCL